MLTHLLRPNTVEKVAEARPLTIQVSLEGADTHPQRIGHPGKVRSPERHEQPDRLLDFVSRSPFARVNCCPDKFPRVASKRGVPPWKLTRHVARVDNNPVEIRPELDRAIEESIIEGTVRRRWSLIAEADTLRPPVVPHNRAAQFVVHDKRRVVDLARNHRRIQREMLAQEDRVAMLFDLKSEVGIQAIPEFAEHIKRVAQGRLMDDQQADLADVETCRSAAILRPKVTQPEAEALSSSNWTTERAGSICSGLLIIDRVRPARRSKGVTSRPSCSATAK